MYHFFQDLLNWIIFDNACIIECIFQSHAINNSDKLFASETIFIKIGSIVIRLVTNDT